MALKIFLVLIGNISLLSGLYLSFKSNRIEIDLIGNRIRMGMSGKDVEDQRVLEKKQKTLLFSDKSYKWGIILTFFGIVVNTIITLIQWMG